MQTANLKNLFAAWILLLAIVGTASGKIIYVNDDAGGSNNGTSWGDAFTDLQVALSVATAGKDIWVAAGTYEPGSSRDDSFQMKDGVGIYGGFAGDESDIEMRDPNANETILSGDVNGDDIPGDLTTNRADNCYHVFYHDNMGLNGTAILDGFIITCGNATVTGSSHYGGGMYNEGVWNYPCSPTVTNCTFIGNSAYGDSFNRAVGGGMYNISGNPTLTNCTFSGNTAEDGGGMFNHGSSPTVTNCTFSGNSAYSASADWPGGGGGMYNFSGSSPTVINCTFSGNSASDNGGGMHNNGQCRPTVTNCVFVGNLAYNLAEFSYGGGMGNEGQSSPTVTNCTFSKNRASYGAGLSNYSECIAIVKNCIFWQNKSIPYPLSWQIFNHQPAGCYDNPEYVGYSTAIVSYSDIDNGELFVFDFDARGNIDADPNFIDPGYWDANGTPEDFTDDIWVNGDYHLSPGSPCIDAGSNLGVGIDKVDLDGDGITNEPVGLDMDGYPRFTDDPNTPDSGVYFTPEFPIVDMGAYEYPGREPIKGDINGDGKVDFRDIAVVAEHWLEGVEPE